MQGLEKRVIAEKRHMWKRYEVTLEFEGKFAASLPKTREEIKAMLENRQATDAALRKRIGSGEVAVPVDELTEEVALAVGVDEEEVPQFGYATFCRDENGLYYEGRCIRGHLKDCATQIQGLVDVKALHSKVANKVYVETNKIYLGKQEPDGTVTRYVQAMTRKGPRSTIKFIDYVEQPTLTFALRVLNDGVITESILESLFEYGATHGMGQERSQDFGRYRFRCQPLAANAASLGKGEKSE